MSNKSKKIAIVYTNIHPDLSAIKQSLSSNENFEIELFKLSDLHKDLHDYSCIIMHGVPQKTKPSEVTKVSEIIKQNIPIMFMYNQGLDLGYLEKIGAGISLSQSLQVNDEIQAIVNDNFDRALNELINIIKIEN